MMLPKPFSWKNSNLRCVVLLRLKEPEQAPSILGRWVKQHAATQDVTCNVPCNPDFRLVPTIIFDLYTPCHRSQCAVSHLESVVISICLLSFVVQVSRSPMLHSIVMAFLQLSQVACNVVTCTGPYFTMAYVVHICYFAVLCCSRL